MLVGGLESLAHLGWTGASVAECAWPSALLRQALWCAACGACCSPMAGPTLRSLT